MPDLNPGAIPAMGGPLREFPGVGKGTPVEYRHLIDSRIPYNSVVRIHEVATDRRAELYDGNCQWVNQWFSEMDAFAPSQWREMEPIDADPYVIPTPTFNEGFGPRSNETARLGRPEYEPTIPTKGTNPDFRTRRGALKARYVLKFELNRNEYDKVFQTFCYHLPLYGTAYLVSEWEETWDNVEWIPHTDSLACPRYPLVQKNQRNQQVADIRVPAGGGVQVAPNPAQERSQPTATIPSPTVTGPAAGSPQAEAQESPGARTLELAQMAGTPGSVTPAEMIALESLKREIQERVGLGLPENPPIAGTAGQPSTGPSCDFVTAKRQVSRDELAKRPDYGTPGNIKDHAGDKFHVVNCPQCPDHPPLVPFQATMDEVRGVPAAPNRPAKTPLQDSFGRRFGSIRPIGQWRIRNASPYNVYIKNLGIDVDPSDIDEWVEVTIEDMPWYANHYPEFMRKPDGTPQIVPESPSQLMMYHPIAGSPTIFATGSDSKLFQNHARCKSAYQKPRMAWDKVTKTYSWNRGRFLRMTGDVVLADADYLIPSINRPGEYVERCRLEMIAWEPRDGGRRAGGLGMWDFMYDAQDTLNEIGSQTSCVRQRMALPMYVERRGFDLDSASFRSGMPGAWVVIDTDPLYPAGVPEVFNNQTIDPNVETERQAVLQFIPRVANFTEVERGDVPPGVSAATTVALLKDEAGESRRPRILRIKKALARLWSHGLRLVEALWIEPRPYKFERPDGEELWDALHGLDLEGQTDVEIAPEPAFDSADAEREGIRDQINLHVLNPSSDPRTNRIIASKLGAPDDLFADYDNQQGQSQREWYEFLGQGKIPEVDPSLDDHSMHYDEHNRQCFADDFRDLESRAKWDIALTFLAATWDADLAAIIAPPPPPQPAAAPPQAPAMGAVATAAPPQPPPFLPSLQAKIFQVWWTRLQKSGHPGFQPGNEDMQQALKMTVTWRAHAEAHKLLIQQRQQNAAPPAAPPQPPAPQVHVHGVQAPVAA